MTAPKHQHVDLGSIDSEIRCWRMHHEYASISHEYVGFKFRNHECASACRPAAWVHRFEGKGRSRAQTGDRRNMVSTALTVPQTDPQADGKGGQSFEAADITEAQAQEDASPPPASMQSVASSKEAPMMSLMRKVKVTAPSKSPSQSFLKCKLQHDQFPGPELEISSNGRSLDTEGSDGLLCDDDQCEQPDPAGVNADDNGDEKPGLIMPEALMINSDNTGREGKNHMWQRTHLVKNNSGHTHNHVI